jgi:hypothetical protein
MKAFKSPQTPKKLEKLKKALTFTLLLSLLLFVLGWTLGNLWGNFAHEAGHYLMGCHYDCSLVTAFEYDPMDVVMFSLGLKMTTIHRVVFAMPLDQAFLSPYPVVAVALSGYFAQALSFAAFLLVLGRWRKRIRGRTFWLAFGFFASFAFMVYVPFLNSANWIGLPGMDGNKAADLLAQRAGFGGLSAGLVLVILALPVTIGWFWVLIGYFGRDFIGKLAGAKKRGKRTGRG